MMHVGMSMGRADTCVLARVNLSGAKASLPLARDHFDKVSLSTARRDEYALVMRALLEDALARARKDRVYGGVADSWRDLGAAHGCQRFAKRDGDTQHYRLQGVVRASLPDVMTVLSARNSVAALARRRAFYGNGLDAQTLAVLHDDYHSQEQEHLALRWEAMAVHTATERIPFDSCALEYTGLTKDTDAATEAGQQQHKDQEQDQEDAAASTVGFKITHSLDVASCGSLLDSHGLARWEGTEKVLCRREPRNPEFTEVVLEGCFQVSAQLSATIVPSLLSLIASHWSKLPSVLQTHKLAQLPTMDKSQFVPLSDRRRCTVCLHKFGLMTKKHHCRACGEVVCKSCLVVREDQVKFCKKCVVVACRAEPGKRGKRGSAASASSSSAAASGPVSAGYAVSTTPMSSSSRDSYSSSQQRLSEVQPAGGTRSGFVTRPPPHHQQYHQPQHQSHHQHPHQHPYPHHHQLYMPRKRVSHEKLPTPSETSYGSTVSSSGTMESVPHLLDEDFRDESMVVLDTKQMARSHPHPHPHPHPHSHSHASSSHSSEFAGYERQPRAPMQATHSMMDVEASIAHQRHLLQEMISQASRSQAQVQANVPKTQAPASYARPQTAWTR